MTVETDDTVERYTISGVGPYAFSFRIFAETDLAVTALSTASPPVPTLLTHLTHYNVTGTNDLDGGTVTLDAGAVTTYAGYTLDIRSNTALEQPTSVRNLGRFLPEVHEDEFDRLERQIQDLNRKVGASIRYPDNVLNDGMMTPISGWLSKYLTISATGALEAAVLSSTAVTASIITALLSTSTAEQDAILALLMERTDTSAGLTSLKRTAAEIAATVTPADLAYLPGQRGRYSTLADAVAVCATHPLYLYSDETITAAITIPDGGKIYGVGRPQITNSTAGAHVFDATSKSNITIDGVRFKGANTTTVPGTGFGGFSGANNGLVTLTTCTDVRVKNCEFDTFYNTLTVQNCDRAWVHWNRCRNFKFAGIIGSCSTYASYDCNTITECTQAGGVPAYGIIVTGDEAGGNIQERCSISFNNIDGIPSWDGIMTHDCAGMRIVGNDIRNVRRGIDVGHLVSTNLVTNIVISGNYCKGTTTDTWGGAADTGGIAIVGYDATHRVQGVTVTGNILDGFFASSVGTAGGVPSHIVVANADDVTVTGNVVRNGGTLLSSAGVYMTGTVNRCTISGNSFQGTLALGGVRCATLAADSLTIQGNTIIQTTASDNAVAITASTISKLRLDIGATNSTAPFSQSTSTLTFSGDYLEGSATYDPPSLADGVGTTTTVTVTGAAVGDFTKVSFGGDLSGISVTHYVSAANTVSVRFQNESGGVVDLGSATLRARVYPRH